MRIIARLPNENQANELVDTLKNTGISRKHMIVSDMAKEQQFHSVQEATEAGVAMIKTERNGLDDLEPYAAGIEGLKGETGILVAVKIPKHGANRVREMMEQAGAIEIIQD